MPAISYLRQKDVNRVPDYSPEKTYRVFLETGTGWYKPCLVRFNYEDGWEYLHLDFDKWLFIPDSVEILEWEYKDPATF